MHVMYTLEPKSKDRYKYKCVSVSRHVYVSGRVSQPASKRACVYKISLTLVTNRVLFSVFFFRTDHIRERIKLHAVICCSHVQTHTYEQLIQLTFNKTKYTTVSSLKRAHIFLRAKPTRKWILRAPAFEIHLFSWQSCYAAAAAAALIVGVVYIFLLSFINSILFSFNLFSWFTNNNMDYFQPVQPLSQWRKNNTRERMKKLIMYTNKL